MLLTYTECCDRSHNYQHRTTVVTIILATTNRIYHHLRLYHRHRPSELSPGFKDSDWVYQEDSTTRKHLDSKKSRPGEWQAGVKLTFAICAWTPLALSEATAFWAAAGLSKSTKPYPIHAHTQTMQEKEDKVYEFMLFWILRSETSLCLWEIQAWVLFSTPYKSNKCVKVKSGHVSNESCYFPPIKCVVFFSTEHQQYWCHNSNSFHLAYDPKVPLMSAQVSVYYFFLMKSCLRCLMTLMSISALMAAHHSFYINVSHTMCIV